MSIEFNCNSCGRHYSVADAMAGKRAKCKKCGSVIEVPATKDGPPDFSALQAAATDEGTAPLEVAPRRTVSTTSTPCPSCRAPLARGAVLCTACGFDIRKGAKIAGANTRKIPAEAREQKELKWWIAILIGIALIPLTIYEYNDLGKWEMEGGYRVMNSWTSLVYHTVGRTGVLVVGILLAAVMIVSGVFERGSDRRKSSNTAPSVGKDIADAVVVLQGPLTKLVLLGLVAGNFILIAAILLVSGFAREGIGQWFLTIFFSALALAMVEFRLWDSLIRKFDEQHTPDNRLLNGTTAVSLLMAIFFGYQVHSEQQAEIERQKRTKEDDAALHRMSELAKDAAPAIQRFREMQGAAGMQRQAATTQPIVRVAPATLVHPSPAVTPQTEPPVPDEVGPAWTYNANQLALLQEEAMMGAYSIRPPLGFQPRLAKDDYRWVSVKGMFAVKISDRTEAGFHPPFITVPGHLRSSPMQQNFVGASKEIGTINGIPFVRAFKEGSGKRIYAAYDGDKLIVISCTLKDPADAAACDAAARTFHKLR